MTTRIKQKLVFNQTSAGYDSVLMANGQGWYNFDINYPTDAQRAFMGIKHASDTISIEGKMEAVNPLTGIITTVVASLATYTSGTNFSDNIVSPIGAIRVFKTGTNGISTVIVAG